MSTLKKIELLINEIYQYAISSDRSNWSKQQAFLKGVEEAGELAEAVNIITGGLPHKTLPEPHQGEIADNINQLLDTLSFAPQSWPDLLLAIEPLTVNSMMDFATHSQPEDDIYYINDIAIYLFTSFHTTKAKFDAKPELFEFNVLVQRLVMLNFFLFASMDKDAHFEPDEDTFAGFTEELFEEANAALLEKLQTKFDKWRRVEKQR